MDHRAQNSAMQALTTAGALVADGFVVAGPEAMPALDPVERSHHNVTALVEFGIEAAWSATGSTFGFPVRDLVAVLGDHHSESPRLNAIRVELCEYALSAMTQSGRLRGRPPTPRAATAMSSSSGSN